MSFFQAFRMVFRRSNVVARFGNLVFLPVAIVVGALGVFIEVGTPFESALTLFVNGLLRRAFRRTKSSAITLTELPLCVYRCALVPSTFALLNACHTLSSIQSLWLQWQQREDRQLQALLEAAAIKEKTDTASKM
jgi:hypothetical protein